MYTVLPWGQLYTVHAPASGVLVRAVTSARLSNTKELVQAAWLLRDSIAGVLIRKEGLSFLPIYLSSEALAYKLCGKSDFWISFNEIKEELKS